MKDIIAGLATHIRKLKKRLDALDVSTVDAVELKSTLDSLRDLETRLVDAKKAKEERRIAKEKKLMEMKKESEEIPVDTFDEKPLLSY